MDSDIKHCVNLLTINTHAKRVELICGGELTIAPEGWLRYGFRFGEGAYQGKNNSKVRQEERLRYIEGNIRSDLRCGHTLKHIEIA